MDPPPQRGVRVKAEPTEREHHGLWLGVFIGALLGLLIGTITLLAFELNRRDALEDVSNQLKEQQSQAPAKKAESANAVENGMGERFAPEDVGIPIETEEPTSAPTVSAMADLLRSTDVSEIAPKIIGSSPADGGSDVREDMELTLTFSEAMDQSTLSEDSVVVYQNGKNISAKFEYAYRDASNQLLIKLLTGSFTPGAQVEVRVTTAAKSQKGVPFDKTDTISFTIAS